MIDEELNIGETKAGHLLIKIVSEATRTVLDIIQSNLGPLKMESMLDTINQPKIAIKYRRI